MKSLQGMYFTDNKITEIPPEVFTLAGLRKLEIAGNQLSVLPREVGNLTKLIHFRLDKNKLTSLPDSISNLKELRVVDFSDNDLAEIPQAFAEVSIRYELRLRGNKKLRTLPYGKGFASMTAAIDIKDTGIDPASLPPEIRARTEATRPPGAYAKALAERGETKKTARDK
ncbi:leucine-rich repeat domain-containing protein [Termitidicoccus mucosus]